MAAAGQLGPEGYRGKGVPGVAERGDEDPPGGSAQSISVRSATIRVRTSVSNDTGLTISVPTPASR